MVGRHGLLKQRVALPGLGLGERLFEFGNEAVGQFARALGYSPLR